MGHDQANQVVGEQVHPDLFLGHRRCPAADRLESQCGLDIAQVQFHLPTLAIQGLEGGFGRLLRSQQRRHQELAGGI